MPYFLKSSIIAQILLYSHLQTWKPVGKATLLGPNMQPLPSTSTPAELEAQEEREEEEKEQARLAAEGTAAASSGNKTPVGTV